MRGAERRIDDQRAAGGQRPRDRMNGADLERGPWFEPRHHGRDAFSEHGLAHPWRSEQHQVVAAGRADLRGPPGDRLADQVSEILVVSRVAAGYRLSALIGEYRPRVRPRFEHGYRGVGSRAPGRPTGP